MRKKIPIFFLTLFLSPFFSRFSTVIIIIIIIVAFLALHVHISSLSSLTKSQGGEAVCDFDYRLFFLFFFFSLFLFDREEKKI